MQGILWRRKPAYEIEAWRWFPLRLSPRTARLLHGQVDFRNRLCEGVAHSDKILPGDSLLALDQAKECIEHLVRMSSRWSGSSCHDIL
jgi:hypothetical protein